MLLVYTPKITNRVKYVFKHILTHFLGIEITLTTDQNAFAASTLPKLNYSNKPIADELFFYAAPLLFERGVKPQTFKIEWYPDTVIVYIPINSSALPFDLSAPTVYVITQDSV